MQDVAHQEVESIRSMPRPITESERHQEWMDNQNLIREKFEEERMRDQQNRWRQVGRLPAVEDRIGSCTVAVTSTHRIELGRSDALFLGLSAAPLREFILLSL